MFFNSPELALLRFLKKNRKIAYCKRFHVKNVFSRGSGVFFIYDKKTPKTTACKPLMLFYESIKACFGPFLDHRSGVPSFGPKRCRESGVKNRLLSTAFLVKINDFNKKPSREANRLWPQKSRRGSGVGQKSTKSRQKVDKNVDGKADRQNCRSIDF